MDRIKLKEILFNHLTPEQINESPNDDTKLVNCIVDAMEDAVNTITMPQPLIIPKLYEEAIEAITNLKSISTVLEQENQ